MATPLTPKIYHITHVKNLQGILQAKGLWSDAKRIERDLDTELVGLSRIKQRRLRQLEVKCHPGTKVGEYVPFYFCPRSIMLYMIRMGKHPDLISSEGQSPILHLKADFRATIAWADRRRRRWAFTHQNAGALYTDFYARIKDLDKVNWAAVAARYFLDPTVKEGKQAEFLIYESFPWPLVEKIGVLEPATATRVEAELVGESHLPAVQVEPSWYI
jgi:hypothetical protein